MIPSPGKNVSNTRTPPGLAGQPDIKIDAIRDVRAQDVVQLAVLEGGRRLGARVRVHAGSLSPARSAPRYTSPERPRRDPAVPSRALRACGLPTRAR